MNSENIMISTFRMTCQYTLVYIGQSRSEWIPDKRMKGIKAQVVKASGSQTWRPVRILILADLKQGKFLDPRIQQGVLRMELISGLEK